MPPVAFRNPFLRTSQPPHIVAVIPARYGSTRFPGKPLADIGGQPMIEHVYRRAAAAPGIDAVVVATDDARIVAAVEQFGGVCRMTSSTHRTGTDRIAEIARDLECGIVVNVQGDEPLIQPQTIAEAVKPLVEDPSVMMATVRRPIADPADYLNRHVVKVVVDRQGDALYFSRSPVPHGAAEGQAAAYQHIGLYAYRRDFVMRLAALPPTPLELAESLEQLRALEHGFRIRTVETTFESIGVDTPEDLERVRRQVLAAARA